MSFFIDCYLGCSVINEVVDFMSDGNTCYNVMYTTWLIPMLRVAIVERSLPPPSLQYGHYFESTYKQSYCKAPTQVPEVLKYGRGTVCYNSPCLPAYH